MAAMAMSPLSPRQQTLSLHDMLRDMAAQEHLLLMGNQGVGCSILAAIDWASYFSAFFCSVACQTCHFVCHYFFQMSLLVDVGCHFFVILILVGVFFSFFVYFFVNWVANFVELLNLTFFKHTGAMMKHGKISMGLLRGHNFSPLSFIFDNLWAT